MEGDDVALFGYLVQVDEIAAFASLPRRVAPKYVHPQTLAPARYDAPDVAHAYYA